MQDEGLTRLRDITRQFFQQSGLQQSIDQRYALQTAHATVIRFKSNLLNTSALVDKIDKYKFYEIGVFKVDTLELVYNDWYQRAANTVLLGKYSLAKN